MARLLQIVRAALLGAVLGANGWPIWAIIAEVRIRERGGD